MWEKREWGFKKLAGSVSDENQADHGKIKIPQKWVKLLNCCITKNLSIKQKTGGVFFVFVAKILEIWGL